MLGWPSPERTIRMNASTPFRNPPSLHHQLEVFHNYAVANYVTAPVVGEGVFALNDQSSEAFYRYAYMAAKLITKQHEAFCAWVDGE